MDISDVRRRRKGSRPDRQSTSIDVLHISAWTGPHQSTCSALNVLKNYTVWYFFHIIYLVRPVLSQRRHLQVHLIHCWYRYVDDVFAVWTGTMRQLDIFLNKLNTQTKNIKFSCKKESDHTINFLDITISTTEKGYDFKIYRKETTTDHVIPSDSRHHPSHKLAAFHSMLNRALNICREPRPGNQNHQTHCSKKWIRRKYHRKIIQEERLPPGTGTYLQIIQSL